jgi:hypothetical protein
MCWNGREAYEDGSDEDAMMGRGTGRVESSDAKPGNILR